MRNRILPFLATATLTAVSAAAGPRAAIERTVAGYTLERSDPVAIRDTATGYYLVRTVL